MKAVVFDYGAGNLHSLAKAIARTGAEVSLETDPRRVAEGDVIVLPGVGAFGSAAEKLAPGRAHLRKAIESGRPCLGICLGMQLLFESSEEGEGEGEGEGDGGEKREDAGKPEGLGVFGGAVTRLRSSRVPQIGWNSLDDATEPLVKAARLRTAYFANGYVCRPNDVTTVTAWSEHEGDRFPAIVRDGHVVGVQFHPEKSSAPGLLFIEGFIRECGG